MRHGYGVYTYSAGSAGSGRYEGEFFEDKKQGWGSFFFESGDAYEGQWFADQMHGHGVLAHWAPAEGVLVYEAREDHGAVTVSVAGRVPRGPPGRQRMAGAARRWWPLRDVGGQGKAHVIAARRTVFWCKAFSWSCPSQPRWCPGRSLHFFGPRLWPLWVRAVWALWRSGARRK